jgi:hypothetical protein
LSRRARATLLAACVVVAAALALVPEPSESPLGRVASFDGDGPEPRYDVPVDGPAIRRAGAIVPDDATYAVLAPGASPLLQGNLKAAGQLFLAPALPVQDPARADWRVVYGPAAAEATDGIALGPRVRLVRGAR